MIPDNPDALLLREATAAALTAAGFPISPKTLATKATRGGGPAYALFSSRAVYRWGDALEWARGRLTPRRGSTSEADAQWCPAPSRNVARGRRSEDRQA